MSENKIYASLLGILILVSGGGLLLSWNTKPVEEVQPASSLSFQPTAVVTPTPKPEPEVISWKTYKNDAFNFTMQVPDKWNQQIFETQDSEQGLFIAFSPDTLPCKTCTYYKNGYFSLRIFNEKTNPELYIAFLQRMKDAGKNPDIKPANLGGTPAIFQENFIAVENRGWVYEFTLDKFGETVTGITDSQIFMKVLSSFTFTHLIFN
jgi:hypothetical protein